MVLLGGSTPILFRNTARRFWTSICSKYCSMSQTFIRFATIKNLVCILLFALELAIRPVKRSGQFLPRTARRKQPRPTFSIRRSVTPREGSLTSAEKRAVTARRQQESLRNFKRLRRTWQNRTRRKGCFSRHCGEKESHLRQLIAIIKSFILAQKTSEESSESATSIRISIGRWFSAVRCS